MKTFGLILPVKNRFELLIKKIEIFNEACQTGFINNKEIQTSLHVISDGNDEQYLYALREYLKKIKNKRIFLHVLKDNHGPGYARNKGIENSKDSIIGFIDSDDKCSATYIVDVATCVAKTDIKEFLYLVNTKSIDRSATVLRNFDFKVAFYLNLLPPDPPNFIVNRSFLQRNNINFGWDFHEDLIFAFKCALYSNNFVSATIDGYEKTVIYDSITAKITVRHIEDYFSAQDQIIALAKQRKLVLEDWVGYAYAFARTVREIARLSDEKDLLLAHADSALETGVKGRIVDYLNGKLKAPKWFPRYFRDTIYYKILLSHFYKRQNANTFEIATLRVG